jgi:hypothetical protein
MPNRSPVLVIGGAVSWHVPAASGEMTGISVIKALGRRPRYDLEAGTAAICSDLNPGTQA